MRVSFALTVKFSPSLIDEGGVDINLEIYLTALQQQLLRLKTKQIETGNVSKLI